MASIYARGNVLWCRIKDGQGNWIRRPTPYRVGQDHAHRNAKRYAVAAQAAIERRGPGGRSADPATVRSHAEKWLGSRRELYESSLQKYKVNGRGKVLYRDHATDAGRIKKHVLPYLGDMKLADLRISHLKAWLHMLQTTTKLASHTIATILGLVSKMLRAAVQEELIDVNPARDLDAPSEDPADDEDEDGGSGRYSREQLEEMISSPLLPEDARVFAALGGLTGLRLGAIAGLRWGDLDVTATPLWKLTSSRTYSGRPTKTGRASAIPVHPVLADMLTSWRGQWASVFGRAPTSEDPIVPRAPGKWIDAPGSPHTKKTGGDLMSDILKTLEIPPAAKKTHALRSTFISIAIEDGADEILLERITHNVSNRRARRAFKRYDRAQLWPRLCAEVGRITISLGTTRSTVPTGGWDPSSIWWRRRESNYLPTSFVTITCCDVATLAPGSFHCFRLDPEGSGSTMAARSRR